MKKHIAVAWDTFVQDVLPIDASPIQISETRKAFYAGARASMSLMQQFALQQEEIAVVAVEEMERELQQFAKDVEEGRIS